MIRKEIRFDRILRGKRALVRRTLPWLAFLAAVLMIGFLVLEPAIRLLPGGG
jgi:hypothetical protein